MAAEKNAALTAWMRDKTVKNPTEVENQVLEHYKAYERRSPNGGFSFENFDILNYNESSLTRTSPMPDFLPSSVILLVTMHARTKEPFITPVNVVRHISSDFGSSNAYNPDRLGDPLDLMAPGFKKKQKKTGQFIKDRILETTKRLRFHATNDIAAVHETDPEKIEMSRGFLASKHHEKPKTFKKNLPMFNKEYSIYDPDDPYGDRESTLRILVRADLPLDSLVKDVFFEIKINKDIFLEGVEHESEQVITLESILYFLQYHGVQDVTLFDYSCQMDERSPIHRTRYG